MMLANVDRYSSNTAITSAQTGALSSIAQDHVGDFYNFMIFFTNRSDDKFTCADFCDYAARMANMPPINDKSLYGLSPLPSDLSKSANYHMSVMDWPGKWHVRIQRLSYIGPCGFVDYVGHRSFC